jgi:hypothetical protein
MVASSPSGLPHRFLRRQPGARRAARRSARGPRPAPSASAPPRWRAAWRRARPGLVRPRGRRPSGRTRAAARSVSARLLGTRRRGCGLFSPVGGMAATLTHLVEGSAEQTLHLCAAGGSRRGRPPGPRRGVGSPRAPRPCAAARSPEPSRARSPVLPTLRASTSSRLGGERRAGAGRAAGARCCRVPGCPTAFRGDPRLAARSPAPPARPGGRPRARARCATEHLHGILRAQAPRIAFVQRRDRDPGLAIAQSRHRVRGMLRPLERDLDALASNVRGRPPREPGGTPDPPRALPRPRSTPAPRRRRRGPAGARRPAARSRGRRAGPVWPRASL